MTSRSNANTAIGNGCGFVLMNLLALLFLGIGGWFGFKSLRLVQSGNIVTGTVVDIDVSSGDDGDTYAPIVEYRVDGESYRMTGVYTSPMGYDIGDKVKLRVDRNDPNVVAIDSFVDMWLMPIIFFPLGLLFFLFYNGSVALGMFKRMRAAPLSA